ncbi:MAG TPA: VTT domain-containing protein [Pyrinomonadaceae bacterium]|jgi:membrane protein YqaA with SNARE-associated domain|nr:VTT domain-containing protein [Pyrinomonadaceae bacterium]
MVDWLWRVAQWLEVNVISLPIYIAAPAMIVIGALDSSLLSLPEINDYLVVGRCFKYPSAAFYFPLFAAIGSVVGCNILYSIVRRGGQAVLRKRFKLSQIQRVEKAYERFGFLAIGIPAILPPPLPFKIFVATAGALEYPRWKFLLTVMIARSFRYYVEGILAVFYGRRVLLFLKDNGLIIISIVGALVLIGVIVYLIASRRRTVAPVANAEEPPVDSERVVD